MNTHCTTIIFIRLLPSTSLLPRGETLFHLPLTRILKLFKDFFACRIVLASNDQYPEVFKVFFACRIVLGSNHQYPGNIQRHFRLQNCLSRKSTISREYSKTFWPASSIPAAISNHRASSSSNQQQQSTAAISSSNQQQQSTTTTSSNNQLSSYQQYLRDQRRNLLVIPMVPRRRYPASS